MLNHAAGKWLQRKVDAGWLPGLVKVASGSQPGFPRRWRRVMAHVSSGRLDCRGVYLRWWTGSIEVTACRGWRKSSFGEYLRLMASPVSHTHFMEVMELETATAVLKWSVPVTYQDWAVNAIRVEPPRQP